MSRTPGRGELFLGYAKIGLLGFGGVAPWARHVIVGERRWLSEREYASILGIDQVLPGPNTVNSSIIIGDHFHGAVGAAIALLGILCTPIAVLIGIALVYDRISGLPSVEAAIGAVKVIPKMHHQAVDVYGWMDTQTFSNLFAVAQLAPGPNVMIVSLIGWQVAGLAGLLVATAAMTVPPSLLAFAVSRLMQRVGQSPWLVIIKDGLVPLAIGMILASGWIMAASSHRDAMSVAITVAARGVVGFTEFNLLWPLGAAIGLGLLMYQLG